MSDVVVTVPQSFGLDNWIAEGDAVGEPESGEEWGFFLGGSPPRISPGERVYIVYKGKLRGYAPLVRVERTGHSYALVRKGGAVAVTIDRAIQGFRGFRYRDWDYSDERPFPGWRVP
jgi:hypothetical protein